jgi:hypothetical protein
MSEARAGSSDKPRRSHGRDRDIGEYIEEHINDEPLTALAIAGAAGFILGGGASSRLGLAALAMVAKIALRGAATNFLVGLFVPESGRRRAAPTRSSRRSKPQSQDRESPRP